MAVLTVTTTAEAASLLADAPSPVVVIPVYNAHDDVLRCLEAVIRHTPRSKAVLIVDDAGVDRRALQRIQALSSQIPHRAVVLEHGENQGYVRSCNDAFLATPGRDVVLLNSDVVVGAEWLERLTAAALSSDAIATASTLTNHGTIVSVPYRNQPVRTLPGSMTPDEAARRVAAASRRRRPVIPAAIGHCFYVRRAVIDLIGPFDEAFSPGFGEEVDFSQRAVAHGFRHVVADDVFTWHRGGASFGDGPEEAVRRARSEAIVRQRHPWYGSWVRRISEERASDLADTLAIARRALLGVTVGVDALCLGQDWTGTYRNVMGSIRALAQRSEIGRLVVFVTAEGARYIRGHVDGLPSVEVVTVDLAKWRPERPVDVLYRPYQVARAVDLEFLRGAADRFVVNQLDTIAFENPAYFDDHDDWVAYRNLARLTFKLADGLAFMSESGRQAALAAGLLEPPKPSAVVGCGVDDPAADAAMLRPASLPSSVEPYLLCVGASYLHKNRRFALEVWSELRRRGWRGRIVLAGPTPVHGSSLGREAEFLLGIPDVRADVVTLGVVTESEKRWLYRHAALVLYPSSIEGFGLVPFEAALHGVPTLATRRGSLDEVLPPDIPVLGGFDVAAGADLAWRLLEESDASKRLTSALLERSRSYTWEATAHRLVGLFEEALGQPSGQVLIMEGEGGRPVGLSEWTQIGKTKGQRRLRSLVHSLTARLPLKRLLSPDGSRRQRVVRNAIGRIHRRLT